jgi:hypothetical protein
MKAAVVQKFGEPLVIEDRPVPGCAAAAGSCWSRCPLTAPSASRAGKAKARLVLQP